MDLVNSISGLQQAQTMSEIQIAVAKKIMDNDRADGAAVLQLLDAASGGTAKAGDQLVAAATGLGGQVDMQA
jgi:hypothetical protein